MTNSKPNIKARDSEATMIQAFEGKEEADDGQHHVLPLQKEEVALFCQLGDLANLDLIYKKALTLACIEASALDEAPRDNIPTNSASNLERFEQRFGTGPCWARSGLVATRVWSIGHHLMSLLATGMVSNLAKRMAETQEARCNEVCGRREGVIQCLLQYHSCRLLKSALHGNRYQEYDPNIVI